MTTNWKFIFQIFSSFFKIGPVTFGGGYAMIPMIEREVVLKRKWLRTKDVTEILAISQSVPGAIAINSATFIGYRLAGVKGAIAAMAGVLLPTFFIVVILSILFLSVKDNPTIESAFVGIRASIVAIIAYAGYKIGQTAVFDKTTLITVGITVIILIFLHLHPILIILSGVIAGIVLVQIRDCLGIVTRLEKDDEEGVQIETKEMPEG